MSSTKRTMVLVLACLALLAAAGLWGGGKQEGGSTTTTGTGTATTATPTKFREAPMLAKLVAEGKLPPVDKRLPPEPVVVQPIESVGRYGGTATLYGQYPQYPQIFTSENFIGWEPILRADRDLTYGKPNLAESYEWSNGGRTLTLHLREGLRWSDGEPFNADDIVFYFEHQAPYDDLNPVPADSWIIGGELIKAEKVDDYTVRLQAKEPAYAIINAMTHANGAQPGEWIGFFQAEHYAKQFHATFLGLEAANKKAKDLGFDTWQAMYRARTYSCYGIQLAPDQAPTMTAYVAVERDASHWVWQRNPYYWKVDPQGNQLPYIDQIVVNLIGADQQTLNGKIITGEADWAGGALQDMPLYEENKAKGNYHVVMLRDTGIGGYELNLTAADPVLRKIFQDVRFRQAFSLALNREEMADLFQMGFGEPTGWYADAASPYYEADYAKKASLYARYDPAQANSLLDQMGLDKKDGAGYRLRPDGKRLQIVYEYVGESVSQPQELLVDYLKKVGVEIIPKPETFALLSERTTANEVQMEDAHVVDGLEPLFTIHAHPVVPYSWSWIGIWGTKWAQWYQTRHAEGEEPPQAIKDLFTWWDGMKTTDGAAKVELGRKIFRAHAENYWKIGTTTVPPVVWIFKNDLKNTPPPNATYNVWNWMRSMPFDPPQLYFQNRPPLQDAHPRVWQPYPNQ